MKKDEQLPIDDQQYYDIVSTKTIIKLTVKELSICYELTFPILGMIL